jgi:hypothetical protein
MSDNQQLYEFTQVLGHALKLIKIANQIPEFVLSKARDINAEQTYEILSQFVDNKDVLRDLALKNPDSKVSNDLDFESKKNFYAFIEKVENALVNVKSPHYKLMLDRYISANKLADQVQEILANLLIVEQELQEAKIESEN